MEVDASCGLNYVVTAHRPTAVIKSVVGSFTGADDLNLIVAKSTRLEVHVSTPQGLELLLDIPIFGRISDAILFRPKKCSQDLLFVLTEKYHAFTLQYNPTTKEVDTVDTVDCRDLVGRPCDNGQLVVIDPQCRCIGLQLYDGMFKILPMDEDTGKLKQAFNTRLDELEVIAMAMMAGCSKPTVAVLYQDAKFGRHLKAYEISMRDKDLMVSNSYSAPNVDPGTCLIAPIPSPLGGLIAFGEDHIMYLGPRAGANPVIAPMKTCIIKAWGHIDSNGTRMLVSDHQGILYLLILQQTNNQVSKLVVEIIGGGFVHCDATHAGRTSSASSLSYLDDGVVYVGSRSGDSQLIKLHAEPPDPHNTLSYIQVLQSWPNLGPIVDFTVMDVDKQGQGQLVCCSGTLTDGTLRVVRNGVGINEQASIELEGIKGLWSLRPTWSSAHHKFLVLSFATETRILAMNQDEELDEAELSGFNASAPSLWCGNSASDHILQVTESGVRAVNADTGALVAEWAAPQEQLVVASGNGTQVAVASRQGQLRLLEVTATGITERASVSVEGGEAACVDVTGPNPLQSSYVAVGVWNRTVELYRVQGWGTGQCQLQLVVTQPLGVDVIPRSILYWTFEDIPYLLVGLGDGQLHYWRIQEGSGDLTDKKKLVLGTKPVILRPFSGLSSTAATAMETDTDAHSNGHTANRTEGGVFAASDRPAVLYSSHKKILFANLNENQVTYMAPFNCSSFPDSLAIAKESCLTIGSVDPIQKLHIHTLPLHKQARRIVYQEETHTLGVLCVDNLGMDDEQSQFCVYDAGGSMDQRDCVLLEPGELGCAVTSCKLGDDNTAYYVVGTAVAKPDDVEPSAGRLLVIQYTPGQSAIVAVKAITGAAFEVLPFQGGRLLNSCNAQIQIHRWVSLDNGSKELQLDCRASGQITSLFLAARGDHVLVGDLMRSVSLYLFKPPSSTQTTGQLEQRAQDYATNWCTAVTMLDDDTYLTAENSHNLFVVKKSDATADEERGRLELIGEYHVGEFINRIRPGSLVLRLPDSELAQVPTWLYGTIDGSIGVVASLPQPLFEFLSKLQDAMRKVVKGVGNLSHAMWRAFENERRTAEARGFVDGDLVELFLDLKPEDQSKVVGLIGDGSHVEDVTHKVEELSRLH